MKVLWQDIGGLAESFERLNAESLFEGELTMRKHEIDLLRDALERGGELIPEGSRRFQGWHVGLLERFTDEDIEPT